MGSFSKEVPRTIRFESAYISIHLLPRHGQAVYSHCRMIEISRRVQGECLCVFLHDEMDCLQVRSGEEKLEVKDEICESRMQGDTRWIR